MIWIQIVMDVSVPRGTGGVGMYYDNDRLKNPLIRVDERGEQSFKEVSWDEAF